MFKRWEERWGRVTWYGIISWKRWEERWGADGALHGVIVTVQRIQSLRFTTYTEYTVRGSEVAIRTHEQINQLPIRHREWVCVPIEALRIMALRRF